MKKEFIDLNRRFVERYEKIDDSEEFWSYMAKPLRQSIRVNTLKADVKTVIDSLSERFNLKPVRWCKEGFFVDGSVGSTIEHQLGLFFVQEASAMIPAIALDVKPGMVVLDMASSPGGKTTQIAQYMENRGCVIANDVKYDRLNILISNLQRCGVLIAKVTMKDGRFFARFRDTFDRVLIDAPCSNVGMIRKNYRYLKMWRLRDVESHSRLQKELVLAGYKALKPGGVLVYSTCTLDPLENEDVIDHLVCNTDAVIERIDLPVKSTKPITEFDGKRYVDDVKNCLRIHPQDNDTEGFFVAKVVKPR
jgi:NOL1/NOP2/sun family putative RNA methylase